MGAGVIPEEVKPPDAEPSAKNDETQPENSSDEDPDKIRGEVFKRMFSDILRKTPERSKKPSE
jgi:hypothetical protein